MNQDQVFWERVLQLAKDNLKQSAFDLESILIDAALKDSYTLSPRGLRNVRTPDFQLINKIRGHKINGSYLRQAA